MEQRVNPEMMVLARESRGLTQKQLSEKIGIEQYELSRIENGIIDISEVALLELARVLEYPRGFFFQEFEVYPLWMNFYRKHKTLSAREVKAIAALINIYRERVRRLLKSVDIDYVQIPDFSVAEFGTPEEVAVAVRESLRLPRGAIDNMMEAIERFGVIVIQLDFKIRKFSGASLFIDNNLHLLFLNKMSPDRQRFTLAHELGHLIMHSEPRPDDFLEEEADRFASEFLMPSKDIKPYLNNLTMERLAKLKLHWKVAMSAILKKAHTLGKVSDRSYRKFWQKMGKQGYRTKEPPHLDPPLEHPSLFQELVDYHLGDLNYQANDVAELILLEESEYNYCYLPQKTQLRLIA
jgi:Zn-dependent peptidase ImmA (M78 family)/transcriptional regulator with XRE-family HTH domain